MRVIENLQSKPILMISGGFLGCFSLLEPLVYLWILAMNIQIFLTTFFLIINKHTNIKLLEIYRLKTIFNIQKFKCFKPKYFTSIRHNILFENQNVVLNWNFSFQI